jgi:cell division septum initiation protein DivIVA
MFIESKADLGGLVNTMSVTEELAQSIEEATFGLHFQGYHVVDVDRFLYNLARRISAQEPLTPSDLAHNFRTSLKGYDKVDVDCFIAQIAESVGQR